MSDIHFYHLTKSSLRDALPALLHKVLANDSKALVLAPDAAKFKEVDEFLWTLGTERFVPHGTPNEEFQDEQPVFLSQEEENPNSADILVTINREQPGFYKDFSRVMDIFDGNDDTAVEKARERWKAYSNDNDATLIYWQQDEKGKWQKK